MYTSSDGASINYLCARSHEKFYYETEGSSYNSLWLRHPTDYDMNNVKSKEYRNYPNISIFSGKLSIANTGDYFVKVGVVLSQVLQSSDDAIVLCISCHRAHATSYADILRWNYKRCLGEVLDNQNRCLACHTTKY